MSSNVSIFWFRQDLRLSDNPGLFQASKLGKILPIYILDKSETLDQIGSASKVYLHHSLLKLNQSLNNNLNLYIGDPVEIIFNLIKKYSVNNVFWNHCYEPWYLNNDLVIQKELKRININHYVFNGSYLWRPEDVTKEDGTYYKVFTAYKNKVYSIEPRKALPKPQNLIAIKDNENQFVVEDLLPTPNHEWHIKIAKHWNYGEDNAQAKLSSFLHNCLSGYKNGRDYPWRNQTAKISPNLHFGEISPNQVWDAVNKYKILGTPLEDIDHFLSELIWREFSCYLMAHFKKLNFDNFQPKYNAFPWRYNDTFFKAWKNGNTGYPIVDAGMRELWQTGYMHNRVRMIVASFLVKNLMIHWRYGMNWFWDCLVDADLANNSASWQWVAGSGADAAPYFRIFNPITQGEKFDTNGTYTRKYLPELAKLPDSYLFKPWEAPIHILQNAGVNLGVHYPLPIINIKDSRELALSAYQSLSSINCTSDDS